MAWVTHEDDIEGALSSLYPLLELIQSYASVLGDLYDVSVLLQYSYGQTLVDEIIFSEKNVKGEVRAGYRRIDAIGLECSHQSGSKIRVRDRSCEVRGD